MSFFTEKQRVAVYDALDLWFKTDECQSLECIRHGRPLYGYDSVRSFFLRWVSSPKGYELVSYDARQALDSYAIKGDKKLSQEVTNIITDAYNKSFKNGRYVCLVSENKEGNKNMNNVKNNGVNSGSVSCTKDALLGAAQEGLKLAAAQKASRELTLAVRSLAGAAYPAAFFDTPMGHVLECLLVPVVLHAVTQVVDVPSGDTIRRACELAMTAEVKDKLSGVLDALVPTLSELGKRLESVKV